MIRQITRGKNVEKILIEVLERIHSTGPISSEDIELITYIKAFHNEIFIKYEKKIIFLMGLFYKVSEPENFLERVYYIYLEAIKEESGLVLTPVQSEARRNIYRNRYYSFSAPTSAGKSYLYRTLIRECTGDILIVVPSRALIAEYMAFVKDLVDKDVLVLQFIENVNTENISKRIYIITPERGNDIFSLLNDINIKLILLDEAQISEEEIRGLTFDLFVRRLDKALPNLHMVFAHPFVSNPEAQLKKHGYYSNENADWNLYRQNTVGKLFLTIEDDEFKYFSPYNDSWTKAEIQPMSGNLIESILENQGTVLIYVSKAIIISGEYVERYAKFIDCCPKILNQKARALIDDLKRYIGANEGEKYSQLIHMMEKGIVVHHGSLPLRARLIIEEFVRNNFAKICFATSTLNQGINMPFDLVWIDNFRNMDPLTLKNLIGRAGRSSNKINTYDYGYVVVNRRNRDTFITRMNEEVAISDTSKLDEESINVSVDELDIIEALKSDSFNDDLKLTDEQVERLNSAGINAVVKFILDNILMGNTPINAKQYYEMPDTERTKLKNSFKELYIQHLRRDKLTKSEMTILSASIPLLLWHIQGKSFSEVVSLRYAYISEKDKKREIRKRVKNDELTAEEANYEMSKIPPKYSCRASSLPNSKAKSINLFQSARSILDIDYDTLVYDTYDYLDKVIALSLANPLCAAFKLYASRENDERGYVLANYIRYGTNDNMEIWLLKYGFSFEDIEWLKTYIIAVDEKGIEFSDKIVELDEGRRRIIERYV
ncbi:MAG: DEAD/DEAH box helicase [Paenibacillaceae bacterium]|nr:DEAD/DEAH box helicase [Paenibacillaceae bacterium]